MLVMACGLGDILLRIIIIIIVFSSVNPMFLLPHLLPSVNSNSWIFPCKDSLFCFPSKIPSCPSLPKCSHPPSIFLPHPSYFFLISLEASPFLPLPQPAISLSYLPLPFFPSLELFPHILNSSSLGSSPNFFPQFVFPFPSPCIASLSHSGFPGGISSFTSWCR